MRHPLSRLLRNIDGAVSCVALIVVISSVTYGVIMRYLFGDPPVWTNELAGIAFTWMVFFGTSVAFRKNLHIGIDLLVKQLRHGPRRCVEFTAPLVLVLFFGYMVVYGTIFSIESYAQPTSIMRLPNTCFYSAVPASFALMLLYQTVNLLTRCRIWVAKG